MADAADRCVSERRWLTGVVTDSLRTAFRDPVVFAAHVYELGAMVVVLVLMIAKPF